MEGNGIAIPFLEKKQFQKTFEKFYYIHQFYFFNSYKWKWFWL